MEGGRQKHDGEAMVERESLERQCGDGWGGGGAQRRCKAHGQIRIILIARESCVAWSRIHERTILLRFLGTILGVLRLEVSIYNVYILQTSFKPLLLKGEGGGVISVTRGDCE